MANRGSTPDGNAPPLERQVSAVPAELGHRNEFTDQTADRVSDLVQRFERFVGVGLDKESLAHVTPEDARRFVQAKGAAGPPSVATMHLRRSVLRLVFRTARRLGRVDGDPTLDLALPRKTPLVTRPLGDEEVVLCRSAALHTLSTTRLAAAWALAGATARTAELPHLTVADLELDAGGVWIHGGTRTAPRWGALSPWGIAQLDRHLRTLPSTGPDQRLVYRGEGSAASRQASACMVIGEVLARAGLAGEPDVRPLSVAAWVGRSSTGRAGSTRWPGGWGCAASTGPPGSSASTGRPRSRWPVAHRSVRSTRSRPSSSTPPCTSSPT